MSGEMEIMFSLAGRMHVLLRREINRIIDVEWMCTDEGYAREVVRLACESDSDELHKLAERVREIHPLLAGEAYPVAAMQAAPASKYTTTLR